MTRVLIVCPGRGSYGSGQLGTLGQLDKKRQSSELEEMSWRAALSTADTWCAEQGLPTITELDTAERHRASVHQRADVASVLTSSLSYIDYLARRQDDWKPVAVVGNSLGWYTALAVGGAVSLRDMLRIVGTTGGYQHTHGQVGGQLIYPMVDDTWGRPLDPVPLRAALRAAAGAGYIATSIDLGGLMVFAGDTAAIEVLRAELPPVTRGVARYPMVLAGHSAFHSPLLAPMAEAAQRALADVVFKAPRLPLVDGHGDTWRPIHADPAGLRAYTLQAQITTPYNFATSLAVAVQEYAPERIALLGPGRSLGGVVGQVLARLGWRGIRDKAGFTALQRGEHPILWTTDD